ncbi:MAG: phosphoribosyl-ATP diphosphatase [Gammaproteobacteria bacterium]
MSDTALLEELAAVIRSRREADKTTSYTAKLLQGDEDSLLKKIVEEAGEVVLAAKGGEHERLVEELADLWFHCLVAMERYNITMPDVMAALSSRRGTSGIAEKAARKEN